jgi:hypothetical protein
LAPLGEGLPKTLSVVSAYTLYQDGPNGISQAFHDAIEVYRYDARSKRDVLIPNL